MSADEAAVEVARIAVEKSATHLGARFKEACDFPIPVRRKPKAGYAGSQAVGGHPVVCDPVECRIGQGINIKGEAGFGEIERAGVSHHPTEIGGGIGGFVVKIGQHKYWRKWQHFDRPARATAEMNSVSLHLPLLAHEGNFQYIAVCQEVGTFVLLTQKNFGFKLAALGRNFKRIVPKMRGTGCEYPGIKKIVHVDARMGRQGIPEIIARSM